MWLNAMHILRFSQFLLAFIVMGLDASVAAFFNSTDVLGPPPGSTIFLIFISVFTILVIVPYTVIAPRYFGKLANKWVMLSAETLTALLWFAGFIASADFIRKLPVCRGSACSSAIAGTVMGAFEFVLFSGTAYFAIQHIWGNAEDDTSLKEHNKSGGRRWFKQEDDIEHHEMDSNSV